MEARGSKLFICHGKPEEVFGGLPKGTEVKCQKEPFWTTSHTYLVVVGSVMAIWACASLLRHSWKDWIIVSFPSFGKILMIGWVVYCVFLVCSLVGFHDHRDAEEGVLLLWG